MSEFGDILGLSFGLVQEEIEREEEEAKTILEFLRERMDGGVDRGGRKSLAQRLGFSGLGGCCGAITWGQENHYSYGDDLGPPINNTNTDTDHQQQTSTTTTESESEVVESGRVDSGCEVVTSGMNLADALAAERQFRAVNDVEDGSDNPSRVSLMRLLEEESDVEEKEKEKEKENDSVCCVCMGRKKGSAFIPCGHTFCRVCSRELWLNRGSCPLCNRPILEILDLF